MAKKIVECVPNFSEGRDPAKIKQITDAVESVPGVQLLNVDPGADTNRTVVTFVGEPESVLQAAFLAIEKAAQIIDMTKQKGAHPRIGASDVVPFIPVEGTTMEECVELAKRLGERVGRELRIPVYLYEEAALRPERKNLADVRRGEYEGLEQKLQDPHWRPDFGSTAFNAKSGATIIGAREFLVAYNITLNSGDKNHATDIAFALREKGRVARTGRIKPFYNKGDILFYKEGEYPCGTCGHTAKSQQEIFDHCQATHGYNLAQLLKANDLDPTKLAGQKVHIPGKFNYCKAIGWYVDEFKRAQISINLTNYKVTPPHATLDEARRLATERGLVVTGSEIVGLVPFQALYESGKHYLRAQSRSTGIPTIDVLRTAAFSMGLSDVVPFEIEKKVLGLPKFASNALASMKVHDFVDEVSRDTPAPGGGSIAALAGSLAAALASMVANLSHGKAGTEDKDESLCAIADSAQKVKDELLVAIDDDTNAFNAFMDARRLPTGTAEEKEMRNRKMQEGLKVAIDVPWNTATACFEAMSLAWEVARIGNPNSLTDAAVGVQMGYAGVRGGIWNVVINLKDIQDSSYIEEMQTKCEKLLVEANSLAQKASNYADAKLLDMIAKAKK
jgi:glutamate formiminotransferase/formiminotetrahydrofolate cyclodeaminase